MAEADKSKSALPKRRARLLFQQGYRAQRRGDLERATEYYERSIVVHPTAEAHTFLGWTHALRGEFERAIRSCRQAIDVDPEFGNPYNDIGAYSIELGRWEEARPWLEAATHARRYRAYYFPHFNLGRWYEHHFDWDRAERHYVTALRLNPGYSLARRALQLLRARRN